MKRFYLNLIAALGIASAFSLPLFGQNNQASTQTATVMGTAADVNGDPIPNSTVVLKEVDGSDLLTIVTGENGSFEFYEVKSGVPYQLSISAKGFADWTSPPITLNPRQSHST